MQIASPALGPVPWSVYCTTQAKAELSAPAISAFRRALGSAVAWLYAHSAKDVASVLQPAFSSLPPSDLLSLIARYQRAEIWAPGGDIQVAALQRWEDALQPGGLLPAGITLMQMVPGR